ncbi:hypothetical protein C4580_00635 [Candidatus Woesearchaeota archaeon]|nr:MAG: hypothetical protein C4580_00635 [Candidatus Woesearchaeota archaeon]
MKSFALFAIMLFLLYPVDVSAQLDGADGGEGFDSFIPVLGNVTVSIDVASVVIPASFSGEDVSAQVSVRLDGPNRQVGVLGIKMTLKNYTGGEAVLSGDQSLTVSLQPDAVSNAVVLENLNWRIFSYYGQLQQGQTGFGRELFFDVLKGGKNYGRLALSFELIDPLADESEVTISKDGSKVGSGTVFSDDEPLIDQFTQVTNLFAGFVTTRNGNPVQTGEIRAAVGGGVIGGGAFVSEISAVGERGGYGFHGRPMVVSGVVGTPVDFYFGDYKLETAYLTSEGQVRRLDFQLPIVTSAVNFPDWDLDGVPDTEDVCPSSDSNLVDANGCTCAQLVALKGGSCVYVPGKGPKWSPPAPPPPQCKTPNKCISGQGPKFCTENSTIINNCEECGCTPGFTCNPCPEGMECITDGNCYKVIERVGLKCLTNKYVNGPGLNCSTLGNTWVDVFAEDPLKRDLSNFITVEVETGTFGGKRRDIRQQMVNNLKMQKVCIDSVDIGCVPEGTKCAGEVLLQRDFGEVTSVLSQFVRTKTTRDLAGALASPLNIGLSTGGALAGALIGASMAGPLLAAGPLAIIGLLVGAVIGLLGAFFAKVRIKFGLNVQAIKDSSTKVAYVCDPLLVLGNMTCSPLMQNTDSDGGIDILFMADGYSDDEFQALVEQLIDRNSTASGTRREGLFSREPFRGNKGLFNVWIMTANQSIGHVADEFRPSLGRRPNITDVRQIAAYCPQQDFTFVVTKGERYFSDCSFEGTQPCYLSMEDEGVPGRQVLRMMGKALGGLADEWTFERDAVPSKYRVMGLEFVASDNRPNCQTDVNEARAKWGDKIAEAGVGIFDGCGGECTNCARFQRPTYNSAMRNWTQRCTSEGNCRDGPPYDPFYIVNEEALIDAMQKWGDAEASEEAPSAPVSMEDEQGGKEEVSEGEGTTESDVSQVDISVFSFNPGSITIARGEKVRWTNKDATEHTVTGTGFDSRLAPQQSFTRTFDTAGTFTYQCSIHPEMQGVVIVE